MITGEWMNKLPTERLVCEFSVWSADLVRLADEMDRIAPYADVLHIDVGDGHFAPALLFFPDLVASIKKVSSVPIHVHLMTADNILLEQIGQFADAGSDLISLHVENTSVAIPALELLERRNIASGMVLKVDTAVEAVAPYLPHIRFLTLLGTAIGIKGVGLNDKATERLGTAKALIAAAKLPHRIVLAADGGIREHTVPPLRNAGAETVVLGSLAFSANDLKQRMTWLHGL